MALETNADSKIKTDADFDVDSDDDNDAEGNDDDNGAVVVHVAHGDDDGDDNGACCTWVEGNSMQNVASIPLSTAALTLHYFCTAFTPTLRYFCVAFSMYLHCFCCASISTEFALRLHCICTAFAISTELHWFAIFGTLDSVALCHLLNYIRECKLFKR